MIFLALGAMYDVYGQGNAAVLVKDKRNNETLPGVLVNIVGTTIGAGTDGQGVAVLAAVPAGRQVLHLQAMGYAERNDTVNFPLADTLVVYLEAEEEEMEEAIVSTTRSSRTIQDIATRIELIGGEEVDEKANMKPGDIRMMLAESTGIQTLQTSATSGNSSIRIQGLDGRYTQVLKDGFPLYAGFSGGLGLLQTPPLDLKRVEVVKGASSTLYGGGAIAGLVNLISKTPGETRELKFLVNGTSAGGLDVNGFYSQKFGRVGLTLYAAYDANQPYAPGNTLFTAIPRFNRYTVNPRLFLYLGEKTELIVGVNTAIEQREGGDINYLRGKGDSLHSYFERNETQRVSSEVQLTHRFSKSRSMAVKNSIAHFNRKVTAPGYQFNGTQLSSFTEVSYAADGERSEWIGGVNLFTDGFREKKITATPPSDYDLTTFGAFVQNTWNISKKLILETGLRGDHVMNYGTAVLPRVSLLYKVTGKLSSRIGGGLGYKAPTIFTEESERIVYRGVLPINSNTNKLEQSYGANGDVNYKSSLADGKVTFSVNQLFFYTRVNDPLVLVNGGLGSYNFQNIPAHIDAKGAETNIKVGYKDFKLFLGYTYTHSHLHSNGAVTETPLTPRHHTNSVLMYEVEDKWKVGLEAYYYSPAMLSDGTRGRDYWLCGFMVEKLWKRVSLFVNFENWLDSRQQRFGAIYTGTTVNPQFRDIYAPLDGFIVNGGVKLRL